jgi:hypothetical protein
MSDPARAAAKPKRLRALGSPSLSMISVPATRHWPHCRTLSVQTEDRSVVRAGHGHRCQCARAIVRAIIDLSDALTLRVVAEGVEDRAR